MFFHIELRFPANPNNLTTSLPERRTRKLFHVETSFSISKGFLATGQKPYRGTPVENHLIADP